MHRAMDRITPVGEAIPVRKPRHSAQASRPSPPGRLRHALWQLQATQASRDWEREYRFHATRLWRFDLLHLKLAVEIEGIGPAGTAGRHQRIGGFQADLEKYAEAWADGWRVLRVSGLRRRRLGPRLDRAVFRGTGHDTRITLAAKTTRKSIL